MLRIDYRTYVPHTFLGFLFDLDDSNVSRTNRRLEPLLAGIVRIPERTVALGPDGIRELFFAATERPTNRPVRGQKRYYSGEKKRHTLKTQVVVTRVRKRPGVAGQRRRVRITAVSGTCPGSTHDKNVYDRTGVVIPPGVPGCGDTAYIGTAANDAPPEAAEGGVDAASEGGEPAGVKASDCGRARDREDEVVASGGGAVAEPATTAHAGDEEHPRPSQPDVRGVIANPSGARGHHGI